jgi:hypothetical protein
MGDVTLANYLGTGSDPNLTMVLSANGPKWDPYNLNYRGVGKIPCSSESALQWSSWDVVDEAKHHYGTINLNCDGVTATWKGYDAGKQGYYLKGIDFGPVRGQAGAYQLSVREVIRPSQYEPFPDAPQATPALDGNRQPIVLTVKGAQLVNRQGDKVLIKGVARNSLEWGVKGQYLSAADVAAMSAWGANAVRIALNQAFWLDSAPRTTKGSYKQIVDAMIYYAIQHGMAVILDLHWINATVKQAPMANRDSIAFWKDVAATYSSFGTVLFELYNEPVGITKEQWLTGGDGHVGYQELHDVVRAAGANNVCIVAGLDFGYQLDFVSSGFSVKGFGILYCSHPYNPKGKSDYTGPGGPLAKNFAGVLGTFPVILTEFGGNLNSTYSDIAYYDMVIAYANANGFHYTGFAWWVGDPAFPALIGDWSGTPINGGVVVHDDLRKNPGTKLARA